VNADLILNNTTLPAKFHLLELPSAFDAIAGLDWLAAHNVHVGMRINLACRASMRSGASQAHEDAWRDKNPQTKHDR